MTCKVGGLTEAFADFSLSAAHLEGNAVKTVNMETLIGVVLIAILGYYGWRLSKAAPPLMWRPHAEQAIVASNQSLVFQSEEGIDIWGKPVYPVPPPEAERTIIFLLHAATVRADLDFWHQVELLLPKHAGLRLVGYCDGNSCADFVRGDARPPDFPVIEYGEIIGSQALVNKDAQGYSILRSESWFQPKLVEWRVLGKTPLSVVQELLR